MLIFLLLLALINDGGDTLPILRISGDGPSPLNHISSDSGGILNG